jgi:hypothetical protein
MLPDLERARAGLDAATVKESHLNDSPGGRSMLRHPLSEFADRFQDELGLHHEDREAIRWVMRHPLTALANRHRAKEENRRKRDVKEAARKTKTYEEMTSRDWQGEPLDLHIVPLVGQRNPRGRDGRRL